MKKLFFTFVLSFSFGVLIGQKETPAVPESLPPTGTGDFDYEDRHYEWKQGDPILIYGTNPQKEKFKVGPGATIYFSCSFRDFEQARCLEKPAEGFRHRDFLGDELKYKITFLSSSPNATFSGVTSIIDTVFRIQGQTITISTPPPSYNVEYNKMYIQQVELNISSTWTGSEPITVKVTVEDMGGTLPAGDTGNPKDSGIASYTWTLNFDNKCPDFVKSDTTNAKDYTPATAVYTYICQKDPVSAYENKVISEHLSRITAGDFFTIGDLTPEWRAEHPDVLTADEAAEIIFDAPIEESSFIVDKDNKFKDFHSGMMMKNSSKIPLIFTSSAISAGKVGNLLAQEYKCNGNLMGTSTSKIYRRYNNDTKKADIKKVHDF